MASWSLLHWLLAGNMGLLVLVGLVLCGLHRQQQRDFKALDGRIAALDGNHQAISRSAIGMGRRVKELEGRLQKVQKSALAPQADDRIYHQASRLAGMGASAAELVENCGMARGEAELLVSLKRPH
ncbi:hypothetical protein CHH28_18650 [Bacterioplanes sanyensis]|uniref:DUF2802 domain-containing protein n=1 Tax=Bacterioplanes sanyensis TaxID=1249553 RepID=A0A222FPC1_9GAMM|nr:DUF2802 domain-containing protein [Bacterioplanes sanyensis]ASP40562.1 hypothetical protein CHH28_18650 [Bacterioplanes sanyensis]